MTSSIYLVHSREGKDRIKTFNLIAIIKRNV